MARVAATIAGLVFVLGVATPASAEDDGTLNKIVELNKKALAAYQSSDVETAADLLNQALDLCKRANLETHPTAARTRVHLGVVYVSGIGKRALGLAEFRKAIGIDPKIKLTKSLINPEVEGAFEEAQIAGGIPVAEPNPPLPPTGTPLAVAALPIAVHGPNIYRINHPPVTEAIRGRAVEIKAQVPPGLGATQVVLAYRAGDGAEFLARQMTPIAGAPSWYHESIPKEATQGARAAYYIEARNADDEAIARSGADDSAHFIALGPETSIVEVASVKSVTADAAKNKDDGAGGRGLWFVLAAGTGIGYFSGTPEMNPKDSGTPPKDIKVSGFGFAQLLQVAPEIGYFHNENLIASVQGRLQIVTGAEDGLVNAGQKPNQPSRWAAAGVLKLTRLMAKAPGRVRPFVSAQVGVGQIRHGVTTACSASTTCKDTVFGGLGLAGAGAGFTYKLYDGVALYAALNVLVGLPNFMVNGDLNIGVAFVR